MPMDEEDGDCKVRRNLENAWEVGGDIGWSL